MKSSQLIKRNKIAGGYTKVHPLAYIQGITDSVTGKHLTNILQSFNHIYLPFLGTVEDTRMSLPINYRRQGIFITYKSDKGLVTEFYKGTAKDLNNDILFVKDINWEAVPDLEYVKSNANKISNGIILPAHLSPALWELLGNNNNITNLPDEEDLTQECRVLSFKDRKYDPESSNLGYKILRKNWVNGVNVLTPNMVRSSHTIYEVRYGFDLKGAVIELPEKCTLLFKGGSFNNGTIICNKTNIIGINKFEDGGTAMYEGTFDKGLVMVIGDTVMWYDGIQWKKIETDTDANTISYTARVVEVSEATQANAEASVVGNEIQFKFGLLKGEKGEKGEPGRDGIAGTVPNYKTYIYKKSESKPNKPTGTDISPSGWSDYPNDAGQWWQCIGTVSGETNLVTEWSEVLPVNGQDGVAQDGKKTEFRFAVNQSAPTLNNAVRVPFGWSTQPPTVDNGNYLWMITATINPDDTISGVWSTPVRISGEKGIQGPEGLPGANGNKGQLVYPAGVYNITTSYTTDEYKAPYVLDASDNNYYVLNKQMTWVGKDWEGRTPAQDYEEYGGLFWMKFDLYDTVFAKIGIIANGLIGSAVFNGDYMFSQQGTDPSRSNSPTTEYHLFNKGHIYDGSFTPNIMFNFKTGEGHLAAGKIKFDSSGNIITNNLYLEGYIQESYKLLESGSIIDIDQEHKNYIIRSSSEVNDGYWSFGTNHVFNRNAELPVEVTIFNMSGETVKIITSGEDGESLGFPCTTLHLKYNRCLQFIVVPPGFMVSHSGNSRVIIKNLESFHYENEDYYGAIGQKTRLVSNDIEGMNI